MSISSVTASEGISSDFRKEEEDLHGLQGVAQRAQSIWGTLFYTLSNSVSRVVSVARGSIGAAICKAIFFPLKWGAIINQEDVKKQLKLEEAYCRNFWDPSKPLDPNCKDQAKIREKFKIPEDRTFPIQLREGQIGEITCRIIETKAQEGPFYNFIYISGVYATIDNNIGIYPYLAAYLRAEKEGTPLPAARFIVVSENNLHFLPKSLDEAGLCLLETLKTLRKEYGEMDQVVAHSLGTVFLANALKYVEDLSVLPHNLLFDRGPKSLKEASKKYLWGFGRFIYFLMEIGKWAGNPEQEIVDFYQKWEVPPSLVVASVEQDHYFSGSANLSSGEKIRAIPQACFLVFNPPRQFAHAFAHHNLRTDYLNSCYLVEESDYIKPNERLSEAIIRNSLLTQKQAKSA